MAENNNDLLGAKHKCVDAKECPVSDECRVCKDGFGPECDQPTCIHGKCGVIEQCSQRISTTAHGPCQTNSSPVESTPMSTPPNGGEKCTENDVSNCVVPDQCGECEPGYSPECAEATCDNGKCKIVPPCSRHTTESTTGSTDVVTTTPRSARCETDSDCVYEEQCVEQCDPGFRPECTTAACRRGRCVITRPCSQRSQCTPDNITQCNVTKKCAQCIAGYSPPCTDVACDDGQCKIIEPCSINTDPPGSTIETPASTQAPTRSTMPPTDSTMTPTTGGTSRCRRDSDCTTTPTCVDRCPRGYSPRCSQSVCRNGFCVEIPPCTIYTEPTGSSRPPTDSTRAPTGSTMAPPGTSMPPSTSANTQCRRDSDCTQRPYCVDRCPRGYSPRCSRNVCRNGYCVAIPPCSVRRECTARNLTQCTVNAVCKVCRVGYSPECTTVTCEDGLCNIIEPCSIYTAPGTSTASVSTTASPVCMKDSECIVRGICVDQCPSGYGPSCTQGRCVNGQCVVIQPCTRPTECTTNDTSRCRVPRMCSAGCPEGTGPLCAFARCLSGLCQVILSCTERSQCTEEDVSRCPVPLICARCLEGRRPPCAMARCEKGECKVVMPCTINDGTNGSTASTSIAPITITPTMPGQSNVCCKSGQCPHERVCVSRCKDGMAPTCSSVKCVNGQCVFIPPCSQQACETAATCPGNRRNCGECGKGFWPRCERVMCKCGVCSVIKPCSKKSFRSCKGTVKKE